jgi:curli biogenesis system outer membrane secretion channel CsgG
MRVQCTIAVLVILVLAGCSSSRLGGGPQPGCAKPTIAVMRFACNASLPVNWKIGDGLKDVLVDRLVATERFRVIERPDLEAVAREMKLQHSGLTRKHQRAELGRIKNVQYLIKGTITDFGHVSTTSGFLAWTNRLFAAGGSRRAVVCLLLQVVDVESGEIICSQSMEESVRASDVDVRVAYKNVTFGGSVFWRKPLGRATAKVVDKTVRRVAVCIADQPWTPRIAGVQNGQVLINGGRDRRLSPGMPFEVYEQGTPIIDPETGDLIGRHPGKHVGRVRIAEVHRRYSAATIVRGEPDTFEYGQRCVRAPGTPLAARPSHH